jgi:YegS/Rv2252/BmrU family lipid kinase
VYGSGSFTERSIKIHRHERLTVRGSSERVSVVLPGHVAVVFNPAARGGEDSFFRVRVQRVLDAREVHVSWFETTPDDIGSGVASKALGEGAELMMVAGGDGTVMGCISALAGTDVPLAILPGGTGNLLALNFDIPRDAAAAVDVALRGRRIKLDVCALDELRFSVMGGMGFDAAMLRDTDPKLKARLGALAYVLGAVKNLRLTPAHLRLRLDGDREERAYAPCVLIGNLGRIQGGLSVLPRADAHDGLLDVAVIEATSLPDWVALVSKLVRGTQEGDRRFRSYRARTVEIWCDRELPLELDGEVLEPVSHICVEVLPGALTLCVP